MKRLFLAVVLCVGVGCDAIEIENGISYSAASTSPDGGAVIQQAVVTPGYMVSWAEDRQVSWYASYENYIMLKAPQHATLGYYMNSSHVGVLWEYQMGGAWTPVNSVAESHAYANQVSTKAVGSGLRGCFTNIGCVALPAPMVDTSVYHHSTTWNSNWTPPGTDPVLPHAPVYLRRKYVIECPNGGYSRPFSYGVAIRLDNAPANVNVTTSAQPDASGVFRNTALWKTIAEDCVYGAESFTPVTWCTDDTTSTSTYCFTWPMG